MKPARPKLPAIAALAAVAALSAGCEREIIAPEHVKCIAFSTGETFTASKANMKVVGDFFFITDDTGKVRVWQMIPEDSNAYQFSCIPDDAATKDPDNAS